MTDISNLFQDIAWTIPCTSTEIFDTSALPQVVNGILDRSGGNHHMNTNATPWSPVTAKLGVTGMHIGVAPGFAEYPRGLQLVSPYDTAAAAPIQKPLYYVQCPGNASGGFTCVGMTVGSFNGWYCMVVCRPESGATMQPLDADFTGNRIGQLIIVFSNFIGPITFNQDGTNTPLFASNTTLPQSQSPVVVMSVRRTFESVVMKLNGKIVNSIQVGKAPNGTAINAGTMAIGAGDQGSGALSRQFNGRIYAALMVNRPTSPAEELAIEEWALARCVA